MKASAFVQFVTDMSAKWCGKVDNRVFDANETLRDLLTISLEQMPR